ncbi:hypothetical protein QE152_g22199 [Popillia japonica]|uniref:Uncharacterized protein n=1 Tax=Popillia japonica TaxID=7064 RepID=A0AAW1KMK9_POPJA
MKLLPTKWNLRTATGQSATVKGEVDVNFIMGSQAIQHRCLVADIEDKIILGTLQKGTVLGWCCPISAIVLKVEAEKDPPLRSKILPEKLGKLVTSTSPELNQTERNQVKELLCRYQDIFDMGKGKTGRTSLVQHKIDTGDARPNIGYCS